MNTSDRTITYHGGGYVGLTGAIHFAQAGWHVIIFDPDQGVVDAINAGQPRAGDFLRYLDGDVMSLVSEGRLSATSQWDAAVWSKVHAVAVPTERNGEPDDSIVLSVLRKLLNDLAMGATILVESTLTPGTIDKLLAETSAFSITVEGPHVVCAPRRDWFADRVKNMANLHRVVGGVAPCCTTSALDIYASVTPRELLQPTDHRTAELVKALENALLHIPVVFCHQLATALPNHNVAEAMRLASTHWRFASLGPLYLGFGTGGRCVPLGTRYLVEAANRDPLTGTSFTPALPPLTIGDAAIEADAEMHDLVASVVDHVAGGTRSTVVLGIAYRPGFKDAGRSPGLGVARELMQRLPPGATIAVHDPLWTPAELMKLTAFPVANPEGAGGLTGWDAVLLATPHERYSAWPELDTLWRRGQLVLDAQGAWARYRERFKALGVDYRQVGEAGWMRVRPA